MATIDEVLRAFLGVGKSLPRATRSGALEAKLNQYGVAELWDGGRQIAARTHEYVIADTAAGPRIATLGRLILHLNTATPDSLQYRRRYMSVPPNAVPSEVIAWGDFQPITPATDVNY